jgi:hypothetical protein
VGLFNHPLLRSRLLPVTIALLAALWFALPLLKALAVPPDNGPIQGSATAVQDPPGSCAGRPNTIPFSATVQIQGGVLQITDPGGQSSGTLNGDGTADLTGQGESYALLSIQGTTLKLREVNGGCNFLTTIVLDRVLFQVVPTVPPSTQTSETASQPTVSGTPGGVIVPETSGGQSWAWYWGAGIVVGIVLVGGGWWYYYYYYEPDRGGAPPGQPGSGFDPVPPTDEGKSEEGDDRQEIG